MSPEGMKQVKEKLIAIGLALAFGALIFVELLLLGSGTGQKKITQWVAHTRTVLDKLDRLVNDLSDAENGRRGYVLSGQARYLGHFSNGVTHAARTLQELRALSSADTNQAAAFDQLEQMIQRRLAIATNSLQARQARGLDLDAQQAFMEQGQVAMEPIRQLVAQLMTNETVRLQERRRIQDQSIKGARGFAVLVSFLSIVLFVTIFVLLARAKRQRRRAEKELRDANLKLEQRIEERTGELSQTIQKLEHAEQRLRLIIDTALDGVITIDASGRITGWNPQAETTFGWTSQEVMGKRISETIIPPRYREAHERGLKHFLSGGEGPVLNRRVELTALRRQGEEFPIELAITPLRAGAGISFSAFVRDITERKRAEEKLRESEIRFRQIAESLPQLVWTCEPDGPCDFLSRQWIEYTGVPVEEQLGSGWLNQIHPEDRARLMEAWQAAVAAGSVFQIEFRIRRHDGVYRWFDTRAVPLRTDEGRIVKWFGSNTDITERKESEEKLQSQLARLDLLSRTTRAIGERQDLPSIFHVVVQTLEENLPIDFGCICLYELETAVLTVATVGAGSAALAAGLGLAPGARLAVDHNGLHRCVHGQLVYEPDAAAVAGPFPQRLARGGLRSLVAAPLIVESRVFGALIAARRPTEAFSSTDCEFLRQLSEHVALAAHQAQLYTALQRAYRELHETQDAVMQHERLRALGQMASGIAHDINNAISPITLYTESLLNREPNLTPQAREYLETIQRAIEDVAHTVARMKEFYRRHEPQLAVAPVALNPIVDQVLNLTRARWSDMPQQHGVTIHARTELAPELPTVVGVESEVREALTNLVFNAIDAMPEGGTLTLRTKCLDRTAGNGSPSRRVSVEVSDTGLGMNEETRRRCLEPFFTTKGERGTGLGLAMVYGIVQRHGGEIEIESAVGQGTTVRLVFPLTAAVPGERAPFQAALAMPSRLRILLIDDDPLVLKSVRDALGADGHVIATANGGQEGIDAFRAAQDRGEPFAVVVTDLGMPNVDGRKVAAAVKAASPATPVILLTGWGQRLLEEGNVPPHVDQVLSKPARLVELREVLARVCPPTHSAERQEPGT